MIEEAPPRGVSLPRLRADSRVLRGLPRHAARRLAASSRDSDRPRGEALHTFYKLDDGSCIAFFEAPEQPFEFKEQHDFDLHLALEVDAATLRAMFDKGRAAGVETRGIIDHGLIDSVYFRDPNGYVVELSAKRAGHDAGAESCRERCAGDSRRMAGPATHVD